MKKKPAPFLKCEISPAGVLSFVVKKKNMNLPRKDVEWITVEQVTMNVGTDMVKQGGGG